MSVVARMSVALLGLFVLGLIGTEALSKSTSSGARVMSEEVVHSPGDADSEKVLVIVEVPLKRAGVYAVGILAASQPRREKAFTSGRVPISDPLAQNISDFDTRSVTGPSTITSKFEFSASTIMDSVKVWPYYYIVEVQRVSDVPGGEPYKWIFYTIKSTFTKPPARAD